MKGTIGEEAREDWLDFSQRYEGADDEEAERVWDTTDPKGVVGKGTIVYLLEESGYNSARENFEEAEGDAGSEVARGEAAARQPLQPTPFAIRESAEIPPRRWLYGRHLLSGFMSLTVSPGGLGKSSLVIVEALAMATGRSLLKQTSPRPLRVWHWNGEDPRDEIERRVAAACLHYGITGKDIAGRLFTDSGRDSPIRLAEESGREMKLHRPVIEDLVRAITKAQIDVLQVDPFATTHSVSENDNAAMNRVAGMWREVVERTGCAVDLIHHATKAARVRGADIGIAQARGASALADAARSTRYLVGMAPGEASKFGAGDARGYFRVEDGKMNMAPAKEATWARLTGVPLGNGTHDYPRGDVVGVVEVWEPTAVENVSAEEIAAIMQKLAGGEWRASDQAQAWIGYAVAEVLGENVGTYPSSKKNRSTKQEAARQRVSRVIDILRSTGDVKIETRKDKNGDEREFLVLVAEQSEEVSAPSAQEGGRGAEGAE